MIWCIGDNHGHFDYIDVAIAAATIKPSAVIFLGDIEAPIPLEQCIESVVRAGIGVHWIRGNHDTDSAENWRNLSGLESMARNIDGKIITIDGLRIAGLGGIFRGEVWHPAIDGGKPSHASYEAYDASLRRNRQIKHRLSPMELVRMQAVPSRQAAADHQDSYRVGKLLKHRSTIFPDVFEALADQKADILVTHEAPSCHPHGFELIDILARQMGASIVVHGHHHDCLDYRPHWDAMGFKAYGVGFCGISALDPATGLVKAIVPGEFDEARKFRQTKGMK